MEAARLLSESTIAVVGLEGAGSMAAWSLAAMGAGQLRCIDPFPVTPADFTRSPLFRAGDEGRPRGEVVVERIAPFASLSATAIAARIESDAEMEAALGNSAFAVVSGPWASTFLYRLNRVAIRTGLRWTASHESRSEAVLGPTICPGETACYLCYQMRRVACADDPAAEFARLREGGGGWESAPTADGLLGHMLAAEAAQTVAGVHSPARGAIITFDALTLNSRRHAVVRVPLCPICGSRESATETLPLSDLVSERTGIVRELRVIDPATAPRPPYLAQAVLANFNFRAGSPAERSAAGKGWTRDDAERGALCEALERYCASHHDTASLHFGPAERGASYIEPPAFCLYADRQYAAEGFPFRRYEPGQPLHWVRALRLDGSPVFVPASETYLSFPSYTLCENFSLLTTTGLSAAATLDAAILGGLYECIERDAFVLHWMNRLTPAEIALDGLPRCESVQASFERSGIELRVFLLDTDIPVPVAMAVAFDRSGRTPAAAVGLGCSLSGPVAAERAVLEVCQVYASELGRPAVLREYEQVRTLEDHGAFFRDPEHLCEFGHMLNAGPRRTARELPETASGDLSMDLARVASAVEAVGASVAFADLTTADARKFSVSVVRTFAAGLQPIHFGFGWERLACPRLYSIAQRLGQETRIRSERDLNFCPHPLP